MKLGELEARKAEARQLGYWLIAGVDADDLHGICRLIPKTPHTVAACDAQNAKALYADCPFFGEDARMHAVLDAVDAALELARAID